MADFLQAHPAGVILALDEMSLYFQATLTHVWAPRGQTPIVAVHPQRDGVHFYGALNLCDGREVAVPALSILATSREPLSITGEMSYPVSPLSLPPASG